MCAAGEFFDEPQVEQEGTLPLQLFTETGRRLQQVPPTLPARPHGPAAVFTGTQAKRGVINTRPCSCGRLSLSELLG